MEMLETDVLIVGAGPAGLAAAIELRKLGAGDVLVVDREKEAGGIPRHCHHIGFGMRDMYRVLTGPSYATRYVQLAEKHGVDIRTQTTITHWCDNTELGATSPDGLLNIKAQAVILATGCRERPRTAKLIPGNRVAGIFTTGSLQNAVYLHHHPVGKRALVIGAEHVSFSAVMTLKHAGVDVIAMVTELPRHQSLFVYKLIGADRYRVPLWTNLKITNIFGKRRIEAVELTNIADGKTQQIDCDTVIFTGDWIPDYELSYSGDLKIDPKSKSPHVNLQLQTSVKGVFAAGNLLHAAETADVAALSGRYVAHSVRNYLETKTWATQPPLTIEVDELIDWISPQVINTGQIQTPHGHFILRTTKLLIQPRLEVWQGARCLWRKQYRQMIPNLPIYMTDKWLRQVNPEAGTIRFVVKA